MESMTGFACVKAGRWIWTLRSVNAKGLDVRTRLAVDSLDNDVRAVLRQNFARGTITAALDTDDAAGTLSVNSDFWKRCAARLCAKPNAIRLFTSVIWRR